MMATPTRYPHPHSSHLASRQRPHSTSDLSRRRKRSAPTSTAISADAVRLAMHRPEPAHPEQLRDATRVLAISLDHHRRERRLDLPGLEQHHVEPGPYQAGMKPLRQRPGFQADPDQRRTEFPEEDDQRLGLARHLGLAHDPSMRIDHAEAASFQGHVDPGIVFHGCPLMMSGADPFGPPLPPSL